MNDCCPRFCIEYPIPSPAPNPREASVSWRPWEVVGHALIVAAGGWLRWPLLERGMVGDEQALLQFNGWSRFWQDSLSALHPPLYRLTFQLFADPLSAVEGARMTSLIAGLGTVVLVGLLARRITEHRWAGLLAAGFVAGLPVAMQYSALFRPYSVWMLVTAAHLLAVIRWVDPDGEHRFQRAVPVAVTAFLLPQVHYASVPWLAAFGAALVLTQTIRWRQLWVYAPSAIGFLPLTWFLFGLEIKRTIRQQGDWFTAIDHLFGMGLVHNARGTFPGLYTCICAAVVVLALLHWRRCNSATRVCILAGVAIALGVSVLVTQHALRPSTRVLGIVFWVPLVVSIPFLGARWYPGRIATAVAATLGLGLFAHTASVGLNRYTHEIRNTAPPDRLDRFLDHWDEWVPDDHHVGFLFGADQRVARVVLTNTMPRVAKAGPCAGNRNCFEFGNRTWSTVNKSAVPTDRPMALVWTRSTTMPPGLPDRCAVQDTGPTDPVVALCGADRSEP